MSSSMARHAASSLTTDYQANISLWLNCNLKCPYCFANPLAPGGDWPIEAAPRLDRLVEFLNRTGTWTVTMSGGEVTIYPGFGELCRTMAAGGHRVEFFTNGVEPLNDCFDEDSIKAVSRVAMSYQIGTEKVERWESNFDANIVYLQERGIPVDVNYVMYPDRQAEPRAVKERFLALGADFRFLTYQGEYKQKQYPFAHSAAEREEFAEYGDLRAAFLMAHGYYQPTFKRCRAGHQTFYISLRTGGVHICEQIQHNQLADFTSPDGPEQFLKRVSPEPTVCPAKRCSCRLTVDQEEFLDKHDDWDMSLFPQWAAVSRPTPQAVAHWEQKERAFSTELAGRVAGGQLYIWAGGIHTLNLLRLLRDRDFPMDLVRGIIDTSSLKRGREILGIPILTKKQFTVEGAEQCSDILISSRAFEAEIAADIEATFGDDFNVIRLYDGSLNNTFEALEDEGERPDPVPTTP